MKILSRKIISSISAITLLTAAVPAYADSGTYVAAFYISLKGIQSQALKGTANIWLALGSAEKADNCNGLARDLASGDLANKDGMTRFRATSVDLVTTINELQAAGIPLSAQQKVAADKASLEIAATAALWLAAGLSLYKILSADDLVFAEKIVLGAVFAAEIGAAAKDTAGMVNAWKSYKSYQAGMVGFRPISKELTPNFADL